MVRKIIKALWILLAVVLVAIVVIFVSISKGWIGYMPPVEELENPNYKFATEVFSEDGKYDLTTAGKTVVYGKSGKQYHPAFAAKAYRMGDCRETGTLLYERRNSDDVSQ